MAPARAGRLFCMLRCGLLPCLVVLAEGCTPRDQDPFRTGKFIACCAGLQKKLGQWTGGPRSFFLCRAPAAPPSAQAAPSVQAASPALAATPSATGSSTITVVEWNVFYQNHKTHLMANVLRQANPDILGLCEFTANPQLMAAHLNEVSPGRAYRIQPGRTVWKGYGTDIIYDSARFLAVEGGVEQVGCKGTAGGPRAAHWVVLQEHRTNRLLVTGGIHTSYCGAHCYKTQLCELDHLYSKFNNMKVKYQEKFKVDVPILWMGDLNSDRWSPVLGYIKSFFEDLAQTRERTHKDGGEIDWIMGEQGKFRRLAGGRTRHGLGHQNFGGSDHFPIYAKLAWDSKGPQPSTLYEAEDQPLSVLAPPRQWLLTSAPWGLLAAFAVSLLSLGAAVAGCRAARPAAGSKAGRRERDGAALLEVEA